MIHLRAKSAEVHVNRWSTKKERDEAYKRIRAHQAVRDQAQALIVNLQVYTHNVVDPEVARVRKKLRTADPMSKRQLRLANAKAKAQTSTSSSSLYSRDVRPRPPLTGRRRHLDPSPERPITVSDFAPGDTWFGILEELPAIADGLMWNGENMPRDMAIQWTCMRAPAQWFMDPMAQVHNVVPHGIRSPYTGRPYRHVGPDPERRSTGRIVGRIVVNGVDTIIETDE